MFTKNYYRMIAGLMGGVNTTLKNPTGADKTYNATGSSSSITSWLTLYGTLKAIPLGTSLNVRGVYFGTGTTPASFEDYKLSGEIAVTSENASASCSLSAVEDDSGWTFTGVYTITNASNNAITIGEMVVVDNTSYCVIERTVLNSPVTIPAGSVGRVTYTIRMNYPT